MFRMTSLEADAGGCASASYGDIKTGATCARSSDDENMSQLGKGISVALKNRNFGILLTD